MSEVALHALDNARGGPHYTRLLGGSGRFESALGFSETVTLQVRLTFGDLYQGPGVAPCEGGTLKLTCWVNSTRLDISQMQAWASLMSL